MQQYIPLFLSKHSYQHLHQNVIGALSHISWLIICLPFVYSVYSLFWILHTNISTSSVEAQGASPISEPISYTCWWFGRSVSKHCLLFFMFCTNSAIHSFSCHRAIMVATAFCCFTISRIFGIYLNGGFTKLLWICQSLCASASMPTVSGSKNRLLYVCDLWFVRSANLSMECGPHRCCNNWNIF